MRKTLLRVQVMAGAVLLVAAASAAAFVLHASNLVVTADGGFTPTTLPKHGFAPIKLHGFGNIATENGSPPPVLETVTIWFDKHGKVETRGLPTCTPQKLAATTLYGWRAAGCLGVECHRADGSGFRTARPIGRAMPAHALRCGSRSSSA